MSEHNMSESLQSHQICSTVYYPPPPPEKCRLRGGAEEFPNRDATPTTPTNTHPLDIIRAPTHTPHLPTVRLIANKHAASCIFPGQ